ncbi:putative basic proline-rich protein-like [Iris pallida]|uniref:Basic proline-rich protein-like n=1 Tax=Iris pallida TaxID=29817 RepID=A0AAX6GG19_IRIPA|nr:putative basic proline-rich protein-like [Iris pallida]
MDLDPQRTRWWLGEMPALGSRMATGDASGVGGSRQQRPGGAASASASDLGRSGLGGSVVGVTGSCRRVLAGTRA